VAITVLSHSSVPWRCGRGKRRSLLFRIPLSSVLSPFVPHEEERKK